LQWDSSYTKAKVKISSRILKTVSKARTPERGCITGALPPLTFERGDNGAQVTLHKNIIPVSNFMIYQDRLETNLLQLFAHR